jgi:hypothetical protein
MASAWFTANELPHDPGSWTGADHEAAEAGSAGDTPNATRPASNAKAPRPAHLSEIARD